MLFWLRWSVISTTLPGPGDCDVALPCSCGLASWLRCSPPSSTFSTSSSSSSFTSSSSLRPQPREGVRDGTVPLLPPLLHSLAGDLHIWGGNDGYLHHCKNNGIVICKLTFYFASQSVFNLQLRSSSYIALRWRLAGWGEEGRGGVFVRFSQFCKSHVIISSSK